MSIQSMIADISRKIGGLEAIEYIRINGAISKNKDLLAGVFITEGNFLEIRGASGMEIELPINKFLKHENKGLDVYRIYNSNINLLIRPIEQL